MFEEFREKAKVEINNKFVLEWKIKGNNPHHLFLGNALLD